ncbi:acetyltransferase [Roseibium sp. TrichSKD4]|uniref:GNAT family N-acetyltransferase n=1 Tax=Roseibium sp. TrichSKD4 TaxID=744980 RepID=UPI0001E573F8|nr:GNAT family N-acetyltransferase [Roseibium sp. TrichSKD4]EFO29231.1 acetyltransferase [Roseibium sp. TrichSKD4]
MLDAPTLSTDRLTLRPMTYSDWPAYLELMQSDYSEGMGGPLTMPFAWGMFCHDLGQWSLFGHGALMLDDRETGETLGQVGINAGPLFPETELGWYVYPAFEGKGYAFEAATVYRDWARDVRKLPTLVSYIDANNIRSRRLAERLGATLDNKAPRKDPEDLVYRHF